MTTKIRLPFDDLNPGQQAFVKSTTREVLLSGGYGAGKTLGLALKIMLLKEANGTAPGMVLAPNWRTMWSVTYRTLMRLYNNFGVPPEDQPQLIDKQGECYLDFGDGAPVYLRSATNVDGYDGLDVGWAAGDECRYWSREAYNVLQGRVRVKCPRPQIAFASTPSMGWMSDEFDAGKKNRELIIAPTTENAHNLADGFIENIKSSYSARLWKALIEGVFTILEGAVFEVFDSSASSPWVVDVNIDDRYLAHRKVFLSVDPGFRRSSWLWIVEHAPLEWIVFDQLMADNKTDKQCVEAVNQKGLPIDEIWCDPAGGNTQSFEGANTIKALIDIQRRTPGKGVRVIAQANREIAFGVDKLRVLLGTEDDPRQPIRLKFSRSLFERERKARMRRGIMRSVASYKYPDHKEGKPMNDNPVKDGIFDHAVDSLRYWGVGRWLCDTKLRRTDPTLAKNQQPGWRMAA